MNFGFIFGLASGLTKDRTCIDIGTDLTWYGVEGTSFGHTTEEGLYSLKWKADGTFIVSFGLAGNDYLGDEVKLFLYDQSQDVPGYLAWDNVNTEYIGTDLALATFLIDQYTNHSLTKRCFFLEAEVDLFISYDYNITQE